MTNAKRMSLEDFQLESFNTDNDIDKMLGLEAAAKCHWTGPKEGTIIDYEWGYAESAPEDVALTLE